MELPQYTVYIEIPRLLFPKTLKVLGLSLLLYFGVWINFYIFKKPISFALNLTIMICIVILLVISIVLNYIKFSNYKYLFYSNRVEYYGEYQGAIMYTQVTNMKVEKNIFDKLFGTGKVNLGNFQINYVPNLNQVFFYVQKMVQMYTRYGNQQTNYQQPNQYNQNQQYR